MDDKKKKFVIPEAEVIDFAMEDIITVSSDRAALGMEIDDDPDADNFFGA